MKIVFEMADVDYENKDFLLQALDFEKAFIFNDIMENCVPLSKVLDDIKSEITEYLQSEGFGSEYRNDVAQIIDRHTSGGDADADSD